MTTTADIANALAQKLREALNEIPPRKKDRCQIRVLPDSGVMTGGTIMSTMEERDRKDQEKAAQKIAKGVARTRTRTQKVTNHQLEGPQTPIRSRPGPGRRTVRFQTIDPSTRLLRSATSSVPRPNYYLPLLAELEPEVETELGGEGDSEHDSPASFAESDEDYRHRPDSPLPRRLRSTR